MELVSEGWYKVVEKTTRTLFGVRFGVSTTLAVLNQAVWVNANCPNCDVCLTPSFLCNVALSKLVNPMPGGKRQLKKLVFATILTKNVPFRASICTCVIKSTMAHFSMRLNFHEQSFCNSHNAREFRQLVN